MLYMQFLPHSGLIFIIIIITLLSGFKLDTLSINLIYAKRKYNRLHLIGIYRNSRYNQVGYNEMEIFPQSTKCINYYPLITNIRI